MSEDNLCAAPRRTGKHEVLARQLCESASQDYNPPDEICPDERKGGQMTDELSTSAWRDIAPNRDARDSMPPRSHSPARPGSRLRPSRGNHPLPHRQPPMSCIMTAPGRGLHHLRRARRQSVDRRGGDTVPVGATSFITLLLISALAVIGTERSSYAPVTLLSLRVRLDD